MEKTYNPQTIEQTWYQQWESKNYFAPQASGTPYCIMIPPPNVTGVLHMGHGFQSAIQDALIRYHRMLGFNTLWQVGTDHAGISMQIMVERALSQKGILRSQLSREEFLKHAWDWKKQSGGTITKQFRRLGISVDWQRECFTLDEGLSNAVRAAFIKLYQDGLIYRGTRLVNWDPSLQTAVSDLEVLSELEAGHLWHIRYPIVDSNAFVTVATSRPETLFGDVAVAVHPEDPRYQALIGKLVELPLTGRRIPIVADDSVLPEFGTGCVKITPAHDFRDYELGKRHNLPQISILDHKACLNDQVPETYRGLDRFVARKKAVAALQALDLIEKIEDYQIQLPRGERSGVVVEPMLMNQWYVSMKRLAEPALAAVRDGRVKFTPENWQNTYFQWLENIQDWCISRQLWWGHRIPAWYDPSGKLYVGEDEASVRQQHNLPEDLVLTQDEDVLDTWFSSGLWPLSTLGWPEITADFKTFYPTSVLVTGFDIIFFWVARMIMMGLYFTGEVPFREVYITPLIRDAEGQKMSKSKGNALDPIDIIDGIDLPSLLAKNTNSVLQETHKAKIEKATRKQFPEGISPFGTDALRFSFCAGATPGRNINFDMHRVEGYRNFCNKLWNASRFVLMNIEGQDLGFNSSHIELSEFDRYIRSRLNHVVEQAHAHWQQYRFDLLCQTLYDFTWYEFCDWYVELAKPILNDPGTPPAALYGTRQTLLLTLEKLLRLLHPIIPFITEEIWQRVSPLCQIQGETIMLQTYPQFVATESDPQIEAEIDWLKQITVSLRTLRSETNISPGKSIDLFWQKGSAVDATRLSKYRRSLMTLAKINQLEKLEDTQTPPESATAVVGDLLLLVPLAGLIDIGLETARLQKELAKIEKERLSIATKLSNENFVAKAPPVVVEKEQQRLAELIATAETLQAKLAKLS